MTERSTLDIRHVSGYGPRCGCGGMSALHVAQWGWREIKPETSIFLCQSCVDEAVVRLLDSRPDQPPYWPGDEDRDEPYVDPRRER